MHGFEHVRRKSLHDQSAGPSDRLMLSTPPSPVVPQQGPHAPLSTAEAGVPESPLQKTDHSFGSIAVDQGVSPVAMPGIAVSQPNDPSEREADLIADQVMDAPASVDRPVAIAAALSRSAGAAPGAPPPALPGDLGTRLRQTEGHGSPLSLAAREFMEPRFGADFRQVRVHSGPESAQLSRGLAAQAFTHGQHIYFGEEASPTDYRLLSHELAHTLQQNNGALERRILRKIDAKYTVPSGDFNVAATPGGSNMPITIGFHPATTAPYSNQIGLIQIVRLQKPDGANVEPQSLPAARGASLRTTADAGTGVQGGFFTDSLHNDAPAHGGTGTNAPAGSALPPQYPFGKSPAQPSPATPGLSRPNSSGARGATVGYKRSEDPKDIKDAELTDAPGYPTVNPLNQDINFDFETVAKGEDTMVIFGALKWSFQIVKGVVTKETATVAAGQSATFDAALAKHRDFYVHEPVIFYFEFDNDKLDAAEIAKVDEFLGYVKKTPDIKLNITGFADKRGGKSRHNMDLSLRRAGAVEKALKDKGVPDGQVEGITIGLGATEDFTPDAATNQDAEANRRGNRRVVVTFTHVPVPAAPGAAAAPAGAGAGGSP